MILLTHHRIRVVFFLIGVWMIVSGSVPPDVLSATGTITASKLNIRPEPGTHKAPLMVILKGNRVQIIGEDNGWLKIKYKGRTGWVKNRKQYIRVDPQTAKDRSSKKEPDTEISRVRKKAETIRRKIKAGTAEVATFSKKEVAVVNVLDSIDFALNQARKRRKQLEGEFSQLEKKILQTETDILELSGRISESREYAVKRLVALYKLDRIGRVHFLASAASVYQLFQRETTLKRILDHDRKLLAKLARDRTALKKLHNTQTSQQAARLTLEEDLKRQIAGMNTKRSSKKELLSKIRNQRSLQMAVLAGLKQSAKDLSKKIKDLTLQVRQTEPTFDIPTKPFATLKGLLKMPVAGKIISKFGHYKNTKFNVENFRSGIDIKADRGEPVRAVSVGKVIYASWFKGYGNMIIIDHGDSYYSVYANIEELFKRAGDGVQAGEVVATVGDTGSEIGPKLHFEIRHHGKPDNPLKWIGKG